MYKQMPIQIYAYMQTQSMYEHYMSHMHMHAYVQVDKIKEHYCLDYTICMCIYIYGTYALIHLLMYIYICNYMFRWYTYIHTSIHPYIHTYIHIHTYRYIQIDRQISCFTLMFLVAPLFVEAVRAPGMLTSQLWPNSSTGLCPKGDEFRSFLNGSLSGSGLRAQDQDYGFGVQALILLTLDVLMTIIMVLCALKVGVAVIAARHAQQSLVHKLVDHATLHDNKHIYHYYSHHYDDFFVISYCFSGMSMRVHRRRSLGLGLDQRPPKPNAKPKALNPKPLNSKPLTPTLNL